MLKNIALYLINSIIAKHYVITNVIRFIRKEVIIYSLERNNYFDKLKIF